MFFDLVKKYTSVVPLKEISHQNIDSCIHDEEKFSNDRGVAQTKAH
ncbi:hypothetical protein [Cognatiyoonia sp. IB215182]|nr:hypothetical protein [Cognatiyoonia sp. IB215182]MDX8355692.1 hypothetical protein [Cognatiyoonia sp. IB215182]